MRVPLAHAGIAVVTRSRHRGGSPVAAYRAKKKRAVIGPAPTRAQLHEAALGYLGQRSATAATLRKALERRLVMWARRVRGAEGFDEERIATDIEEAKQNIEAILSRFREVGLINDEAYAKSRAASLSRGGRSRRAIEAHLTAKGVARSTIQETVSRDASVELRAALVFARKRRLGPFTRDEEEEVTREAKRKSLATMARAGFSYSTCERALGMDRESAEEELAASPD